MRAEELAPFGAQDDDAAMPHSLIADPVGEVAIQSGAVVSKVVHRGDGMNVTVFGFDSGEGSPSISQVVLQSFRSCPEGFASRLTASSSNWGLGHGSRWLLVHPTPSSPASRP